MRKWMWSGYPLLPLQMFICRQWCHACNWLSIVAFLSTVRSQSLNIQNTHTIMIWRRYLNMTPSLLLLDTSVDDLTFHIFFCFCHLAVSVLQYDEWQMNAKTFTSKDTNTIRYVKSKRLSFVYVVSPVNFTI